MQLYVNKQYLQESAQKKKFVRKSEADTKENSCFIVPYKYADLHESPVPTKKKTNYVYDINTYIIKSIILI